MHALGPSGPPLHPSLSVLSGLPIFFFFFGLPILKGPHLLGEAALAASLAFLPELIVYFLRSLCAGAGLWLEAAGATVLAATSRIAQGGMVWFLGGGVPESA